MQKGFVRISAIVLIVAAVSMLALGVRQYRKDSRLCQSLYTSANKKRDIVDAARNALEALEDAEIQAQDYVLTGETVYSEAYAEDLRSYMGESGTLELVAAGDLAAPLGKNLSNSGKLTVDELTLIVSLYEKSGRDAALERIRKSSAIVYLDKVREIVAEIRAEDGGAGDGNNRLISITLLSQRYLTEAAAALFIIAVAATLLLILEMRRAWRSTGSPLPG